VTTLLVDGNNLLARADHAAKNQRVQMSVDGVSTAGLVIFINLLSKYVRLVNPSRMAVFWDAGHTFRDEAYPGYKANRVKSEGPEGGDSLPFAQAKEFLTWAGVPHKAHTGWEADDLIAATARQTMGRIVILSGDKDLLQLVDLSFPTEVTQIRVPDETEWTATMVEEKFGVPPHHLSHYLALVGDTSDGVPGVRGIGPKKAVALLEAAEWDWDRVVVDLGPERGSTALLMHQIVDLRTFPYDDAFMAAHAGAPPFRPTAPDTAPTSWGNLLRFCATYRLESLRERLEAGTLWAERSTMAEVFSGFDD